MLAAFVSSAWRRYLISFVNFSILLQAVPQRTGQSAGCSTWPTAVMRWAALESGSGVIAPAMHLVSSLTLWRWGNSLIGFMIVCWIRKRRSWRMVDCPPMTCRAGTLSSLWHHDPDKQAGILIGSGITGGNQRGGGGGGEGR
jgi:hypothetical protein